MSSELGISVDGEAVRRAVEASLETVTGKAVKDAVESLTLRFAIRDAAAEAFASLDIPAMVKAHMDRLLAERADDLVREAAEASMGALKGALEASIRAQSIGMAYGILLGRPGRYVSESESHSAWRRAEQMCGVGEPAASAEADDDD